MTFDVNRTYTKHLANQFEKVKSKESLLGSIKMFKTTDCQVMLTLWLLTLGKEMICFPLNLAGGGRDEYRNNGLPLKPTLPLRLRTVESN